MKSFVPILFLAVLLCQSAWAEYWLAKPKDKGKPTAVLVLGVANHSGQFTKPGDLLVISLSNFQNWQEKKESLNVYTLSKSSFDLVSVTETEFDKVGKKRQKLSAERLKLESATLPDYPNYPKKASELAQFLTHRAGVLEFLRHHYNGAGGVNADPPPNEMLIPRAQGERRIGVALSEKVTVPLFHLGTNSKTGNLLVVPVGLLLETLRDGKSSQAMKLVVYELPGRHAVELEEQRWNLVRNPGSDESVETGLKKISIDSHLITVDRAIWGGINPALRPAELEHKFRRGLFSFLNTAVAEGVGSTVVANGEIFTWPYFRQMTMGGTGDGLDMTQTLKDFSVSFVDVLVVGRLADKVIVIPNRKWRPGEKVQILEIDKNDVSIHVSPSEENPSQAKSLIEISLSDIDPNFTKINSPEQAAKFLESVRKVWKDHSDLPVPELMVHSVAHRPITKVVAENKPLFPLNPKQANRFLLSGGVPYGGSVIHLFLRADTNKEFRSKVTETLNQCKSCEPEREKARKLGMHFRKAYFGQLAKDFPAHDGLLGYVMNPDSEVKEAYQSFLLGLEEIGEVPIKEEAIWWEEFNLVKAKLHPATTQGDIKRGYRMTEYYVKLTPWQTLVPLMRDLRAEGYEELSWKVFNLLWEKFPIPITVADVDSVFQEAKLEGVSTWKDFIESRKGVFTKYVECIAGNNFKGLIERRNRVEDIPDEYWRRLQKRAQFRIGEVREQRRKDAQSAKEAYRDWKKAMGKRFQEVRTRNIRKAIEHLLPATDAGEFTFTRQGGATKLQVDGELFGKATIHVDPIVAKRNSLDMISSTEHSLARNLMTEGSREQFADLMRAPQRFINWLQTRNSKEYQELRVADEGSPFEKAPMAARQPFVRFDFSGVACKGHCEYSVPLQDLYAYLSLKTSERGHRHRNSMGLSPKEFAIYIREAVARDQALKYWQDFFENPEAIGETYQEFVKRLEAAHLDREIPIEGHVSLTENIRRRKMAEQPEDLINGLEWSQYRNGAHAWQRRDAKADHLGRPSLKTPTVSRKEEGPTLLDRAHSVMESVASTSGNIRRGVASTSGNIRRGVARHWKKIVTATTLAGALYLGVHFRTEIADSVKAAFVNGPAQVSSVENPGGSKPGHGQGNVVENNGVETETRPSPRDPARETTGGNSAKKRSRGEPTEKNAKGEPTGNGVKREGVEGGTSAEGSGSGKTVKGVEGGTPAEGSGSGKTVKGVEGGTSGEGSGSGKTVKGIESGTPAEGSGSGKTVKGIDGGPSGKGVEVRETASIQSAPHVMSVKKLGDPSNALPSGTPVKYFEIKSENTPLEHLPRGFNYPLEKDMSRIVQEVELKTPGNGMKFRQIGISHIQAESGKAAVPYSPGFGVLEFKLGDVPSSQYTLRTDPLHQYLVVEFKEPHLHEGKDYSYELRYEADESYSPNTKAAEFRGLDRQIISELVEELRRDGMVDLADSLAKHTRLGDETYKIHLLDIDRAFAESGLYSDRDPSKFEFPPGGTFGKYRKYLDGEVLKMICGPGSCLRRDVGAEYYRKAGMNHVVVENQMLFRRGADKGLVTSQDGHLQVLTRLEDNSAALRGDGTPGQMDPETAKRLQTINENSENVKPDGKAPPKTVATNSVVPKKPASVETSKPDSKKEKPDSKKEKPSLIVTLLFLLQKPPELANGLQEPHIRE